MSSFDSKSKIILTGGSGFLGTHLLRHEAFKNAITIGRSNPSKYHSFKSLLLNKKFDASKILQDIDIVVHVAARAHIMNEKDTNSLEKYRQINTFGTLELAKQAALAGVKRFIFISTIKVLGEETMPGRPFNVDSPYNPCDFYSISKTEAEKGLKDVSKNYGMEIVIIRPPLVYGNGVKGNFASLIRLVKFPIPMPFKSINNKRSLVSVDNLVDLIIVCLKHPNAKNKTFLVSDGKDMSTPELFLEISKAMGHRNFVFSFPKIFLFIFFRIIGKLSVYKRLFGSIQVNIDYTRTQLDWDPPYEPKDSLKKLQDI